MFPPRYRLVAFMTRITIWVNKNELAAKEACILLCAAKATVRNQAGLMRKEGIAERFPSFTLATANTFLQRETEQERLCISASPR